MANIYGRSAAPYEGLVRLIVNPNKGVITLARPTPTIPGKYGVADAAVIAEKAIAASKQHGYPLDTWAFFIRREPKIEKGSGILGYTAEQAERAILAGDTCHLVAQLRLHGAPSLWIQGAPEQAPSAGRVSKIIDL